MEIAASVVESASGLGSSAGRRGLELLERQAEERGSVGGQVDGRAESAPVFGLRARAGQADGRLADAEVEGDREVLLAGIMAAARLGPLDVIERALHGEPPNASAACVTSATRAGSIDWSTRQRQTTRSLRQSQSTTSPRAPGWKCEIMVSFG